MSSNKIQKFLLFFFIILTLVLATFVVILYVNNSKVTDHGIVTNSGIIRITTDPTNVSYNVYLDDKKQNLVDNRINDVTNGQYTIKVQAQNYTDWTKKVIVKNGIVTDLLVKLFPSKLSITQVTQTNIGKAFVSIDGLYIYYVVKSSEFGSDTGIWRVATEQSTSFFTQIDQNPLKLTDMTTQIQSVITGSDYTLTPNIDNTKLLIHDRKNNKFYVLNASDFNSTITDIGQMVGFVPDNASWMVDGSDLLVSTQNILFDLNINSGTTNLIEYRPNYKIIYANNETSVYVYENSEKALYKYQNQKLTKIDLKNIAITEDVTAITVPGQNSNVLLLKTASGYYYLNLTRLYIKDILNGVKNPNLVTTSNDGTSSLFSTDSNLCYIFNAIDNIASNSIETKETKIDEVDCSSAGYVAFAPQSTHLIYLYKIDSSIRSIEPDGSNKSILITDASLQPFANFNRQSDYLFVLMKDDSTSTSKTNLYKVQLVNK